MVVIQPIRNQYLTALKERQHIIDKLNEIIRGLNALDFDDLTTIHTELVSIREALTTQNQTITEINDNIEQIESELTSFDNRLIGLNADITDTEAHLTEFENDTIANLQAKVNKNGDTMTGNLGIPTSETGVRNNLVVNGERLQNDLDNYAPMLRTSGNQEKVGIIFNKTTGENYVVVGGNSIRWVRLFYTDKSDAQALILILPDKESQSAYSGFVFVGTRNTSGFAIIKPLLATSLLTENLKITYDGEKWEIWYYYNANGTNRRISASVVNSSYNRAWISDGITERATIDVNDFQWVENGVVI